MMLAPEKSDSNKKEIKSELEIEDNHFFRIARSSIKGSQPSILFPIHKPFERSHPNLQSPSLRP